MHFDRAMPTSAEIAIRGRLLAIEIAHASTTRLRGEAAARQPRFRRKQYQRASRHRIGFDGRALIGLVLKLPLSRQLPIFGACRHDTVSASTRAPPPLEPRRAVAFSDFTAWRRASHRIKAIGIMSKRRQRREGVSYHHDYLAHQAGRKMNRYAEAAHVIPRSMKTDIT